MTRPGAGPANRLEITPAKRPEITSAKRLSAAAVVLALGGGVINAWLFLTR